MDALTASLASVIGGRVSAERQARRLTLDQLAERAGVSRRMLVNVEQGATNPSIGTLLRISDALGVGLPALVEPPGRPAVKVTRRGHGAELWAGPAGGTGVLVAGTRPPDVLELWDWVLAAGERHESEAHAAGTHEVLHVLDGTLTLEVDDETIALDQGDAVAFPGDVPHCYANATARAVRFSLAVFEPGVGAGAGAGAGAAAGAARPRIPTNHENPNQENA